MPNPRDSHDRERKHRRSQQYAHLEKGQKRDERRRNAFDGEKFLWFGLNDDVRIGIEQWIALHGPLSACDIGQIYEEASTHKLSRGLTGYDGVGKFMKSLLAIGQELNKLVEKTPHDYELELRYLVRMVTVVHLLLNGDSFVGVLTDEQKRTLLRYLNGAVCRMELVQPALEEAYAKRDEDKSPKALNELQTRIYNREQLQRQAAFERRDALDKHISGGRDSGTVWIMPEDLYAFTVDIGFNGCKILCVHLYEDDPGAAHRTEWHCSADRYRERIANESWVDIRTPMVVSENQRVDNRMANYSANRVHHTKPMILKHRRQNGLIVEEPDEVSPTLSSLISDKSRELSSEERHLMRAAARGEYDLIVLIDAKSRIPGIDPDMNALKKVEKYSPNELRQTELPTFDSFASAPPLVTAYHAFYTYGLAQSEHQLRDRVVLLNGGLEEMRNRYQSLCVERAGGMFVTDRSEQVAEFGVTTTFPVDKPKVKMPPVRAAIRNPRKLVPSAYYVYVQPKDLNVRELTEEQLKSALEYDFDQRYGGEDEDEDSSDESSFEEEDVEAGLSDNESDTSQPSLYPDLTEWLTQAVHRRQMPRVDRVSAGDEEKSLGEVRPAAAQASTVQVPPIDRSNKPSRLGAQLPQSATPIVDRSTKPIAVAPTVNDVVVQPINAVSNGHSCASDRAAAQMEMLNLRPTKRLEFSVDDTLVKPRYVTDKEKGDVLKSIASYNREMTAYMQSELFGGERIAMAAGLRNQGNFCFANATVQMLLSIDRIVNVFETYEIFDTINIRNRSGTGGRMLVTFFAVLMFMRDMSRSGHKLSKYRATDIRRLVILLDKCVNTQFGDKRQHDAQEFCSKLLDAVHEDCNSSSLDDPEWRAQEVVCRKRIEGHRKRLMPFLNDADTNTAKLAVRAMAQLEWNSWNWRASSRLYDIIRGMYVQTLSCRACGHSSYTFDAFTQLTLELPSEGLQIDLSDCLDAHFREENLALETKWRCENCQDYRAAVKRHHLWHVPDVIFVHLKRFQSVHQKYRANVLCPIELFVSNKHKHEYSPEYGIPQHYILKATVNHRGTLNSKIFFGLFGEGGRKCSTSFVRWTNSLREKVFAPNDRSCVSLC